MISDQGLLLLLMHISLVTIDIDHFRRAAHCYLSNNNDLLIDKPCIFKGFHCERFLVYFCMHAIVYVYSCTFFFTIYFQLLFKVSNTKDLSL